MTILQQVISAARTVRSEHEIDRKAEVALATRTDDSTVRAFLEDHAAAIRDLVRTKGEPLFEGRGGAREAGTSVSVVPTGKGPIEVLVGLKGLVTKEDEIARIDREMKKVEKDVAVLEKRLGSAGFVDRAPPEVVEEARKQLASLLEARTRLGEARKLAEEL